MKNYCVALLLLFFWNGLQAQPIVTVKPDTITVYAPAIAGKDTTIVVQVPINYNGPKPKKDYPVRLTTINSSSPALVTLQVFNPINIPAADFRPTTQSRLVSILLRLSVAPLLMRPESVDITVQNGLKGQPNFRVIIAPRSSANPPAQFSEQLLPITPDTIRLQVQRGRNTTLEQARFVVLRTGADGANRQPEVEIQSLNGNQVKARVVSARITGTATVNGSYRDTVAVQLQLDALDQLTGCETIELKLKNNAVRQPLVICSRDTAVPQNSFWVEAGANFDLVEKLKPNNLFVGVFFYKRDIGRISLRSKTARNPVNRNLAITTGIYQSKSTGSQTVNEGIGQFSDITSLNPNSQQQYPVYRDTGTTKLNVTVNSISLFFSPQVRLTRKPGNIEGLHVYLPLWSEFLWQRTESRYDYSGRKVIDTSYVTRGGLSSYPQRPRSANQDFRSVYFGSGLSGFYKEGNANLYVQTIVGFTNQRFQIPTARATAQTRVEAANLAIRVTTGWNAFFLTTFRLSEEKYGFAFTGELRGMLIQGVKPVFSLALSKKFNLSKIVEFQ